MKTARIYIGWLALAAATLLSVTWVVAHARGPVANPASESSTPGLPDVAN